MTRQEKLQQIRNHPEQHQHQGLNDLHACCWDDNALDLELIDAHSHYNGHDVKQGPCSCGAFH